MFIALKKILLILFVLILVAFGTSYIFTRFYLDDFLRTELKKIVDESTDGFYQLSVDKLSTNILLGSLKANNIQLSPNPQKFSGFVLQNGNLYAVKVRTLSIKGFQLWDMYRNKELIVNKLEITEPEILITRKFAKEDTSIKRINLKELLLKRLHKIEIGNIAFNKARIIYLDSLNKKSAEHSLSDVFFELKKFYVDENSTLKDDKYYFADNITFSAAKYFYSLPGEMYDLKIENTSFSARDSIFAIKSLRLIPKLSRQKFTAKNKFATDYIELNLDEIEAKGLDVRSLLYSSKVICDSIKFGKLNLIDFKDKRKILDPNAYKKLPTTLLKSLPVHVDVKFLAITDANVAYEEIAENRTMPGKIIFTKLNVVLSNIVNDSLKINQNPTMQLKSTGNLMGSTPFSASIDFDLKSSKDEFNMSGKVSRTPFSIFNKLIYNLSGIETDEGMMDELKFNFNANNENANGVLIFMYHDLKINLNNKTENNKNRFKNIAANTFVLNANPIRNQEARKGTIKFSRDKSKFIFNYIWKSLFSGIKETALNNSAIKSLQSMRKTHKSIFNRDPEKVKQKNLK